MITLARVHWKLTKNFNFDSILESGNYKIYWDFSIQSDHIIEAWRPDLVVVDKKRTCKITDFAVPRKCEIEEKEKEETEKYQDLRRELRKIWNVTVRLYH